MKRKIIPVLIGCALSFSGLAAQPTAERYVVSFPEGSHVSYSGAFASAFPNGLPVGIGSGLLFTGKQGDALTFATVTDRGPNADAPKMGKNEAKIFVTPDFAPLLMTIRVQNGKAEATDARPLHDDKGEINGLPLQSGVIGSTNEVAFSDTLKVLKGDNRGLDTEGITPDGKGGYWLCDEYGPFLINVDSKGKILAVHGPQAAEGEKSVAGGLPNIIKWRQPNRGFEGLTRMPDGRIIAAVQSTLDIDGKSKKKALFTRLVSFDPASGKYKCEYCLSSFTQEEAEKANPKAAEALNGEDDAAGAQEASDAQKESSTEETKGETEQGEAVVYTCPNCGAEIVTDATTAATYCFYCHNPVVLSGRLSGEYMPDFVLPFKISKEQAIEKFLSFARKKRFIPKDFFEKNQVQKMTGVYFPYWIYGGDFETDYMARGRKVRVWQTGDVEYTETSIYDVRREGEVRVDGLSRNALNKADRDLIECVQPYRLEEMQPFSMGYLSGFQAEKRDIEQAQIAPELKKELETMARGAMRNEANEYISLEQEKMKLSPKREDWRYVLFPVWTLTYPGKDGKVYYYAMNGQTGTINGDFPFERKKALLTSVVSALFVLIFMLVGGYFS